MSDPTGAPDEAAPEEVFINAWADWIWPSHLSDTDRVRLRELLGEFRTGIEAEAREKAVEECVGVVKELFGVR